MNSEDYLCYTIDDISLGMPLHCVDRVIRAVAVKPIPNPPRNIHKLIDFFGEIIPVINLRRRLGLKETNISSDQIFILITTEIRKLALTADAASGVISFPASGLIQPGKLDSGFEATGIYRTEEGIILIYDPEKFLTAEEEIQLEAAIHMGQTNQNEYESPSETA